MIRPAPGLIASAVVGVFSAVLAVLLLPIGDAVSRAANSAGFDDQIRTHEQQLMDQGRQTFRYDSFGSEAFWGDLLKLPLAIEGAKLGGVGPGVSPKAALAVGLKVDADALPTTLLTALQAGQVDLDDPATTLALLKLNAVVGLKGNFDTAGHLRWLGITCALCHARVDDAVSAGIGHRLDGWPNQDLDVGAITALSPDLSAVDHLLGVDDATTRQVLSSWGPGKFDAELFMDGKGFRPDGKSAATLIPPAFGLAGVNLHTWTGWGQVTYWNAFVANLEMHGTGRFFDPRLNDPQKFPIAVKAGFFDLRPQSDEITSKLAGLHFYQLAIPAPAPPAGSFDPVAALRGRDLFTGKASCASCHTLPLFTEPGWNLHTAQELGIDDFQAQRSPAVLIAGKEVVGYRTAPLQGLWTHEKRGFYHDGRFATLRDVVDHYDQVFHLGLTTGEANDLVEYLKSLGDEGAPTSPAPPGGSVPGMPRTGQDSLLWVGLLLAVALGALVGGVVLYRGYRAQRS
jgi:hypothetical protein